MVNERTTAYLTVTFRDKASALAVPSTITWSCRDKITGTILQDSVVFSAPNSSIEITLPPELNVILDPVHAQETRVITVSATYGTGDSNNSSFEYSVRNLKYIS